MSDESEQRQRLTWAREKAGYDTASAAAAAFGWVQSTYSAHENGQNKLKVGTARQYATAFRVSLCWLLAGEGKPNGEPHELAGLWERLTEPQRLRVVGFAEGMLAEQPPPPVPQPPPVAPSNVVRTNFKEQPEFPTIHSGNRRPRPVHLPPGWSIWAGRQNIWRSG
jgi:DNA-binding XRE family transcriptional regulator